VQDRERVVAVVALDHVALVDHLGEQRGGEEFLELDHLPAPLTAVRTATPTPRISRRRRRATIPPPRTTRTGARARSQEISSTPTTLRMMRTMVKKPAKPRQPMPVGLTLTEVEGACGVLMLGGS